MCLFKENRGVHKCWAFGGQKKLNHYVYIQEKKWIDCQRESDTDSQTQPQHNK